MSIEILDKTEPKSTEFRELPYGIPFKIVGTNLDNPIYLKVTGTEEILGHVNAVKIETGELFFVEKKQQVIAVKVKCYVTKNYSFKD